MKTMKSITLAVLLIALSSPFALSQNFDANRMNRDINIMENILGEMFKTQSIVNRSAGAVSVARAVTISGFNSNSVRGTYMPGYGVIFMINNNLRFPSGVSISSEDGYSFYYSTDEDPEDAPAVKIDQESVTNRIQDFLMDYASTIGQLKSDENVIVIYGNQSRSMNLFTYSVGTTSGGAEKPEALPVISVSAKKSDLDAFRAGRIGDEAFANRVAVATSEDREYLDLKVMSNIFETALKSRDEESFRLYGNIDYLMLDNFGAIFNLDAGFSSGGGGNAFFSIRGITTSGAYVRSTGKTEVELKKEQEEYLEKVSAAFVQLKQDLKEYLVDYGRTLSSVKPDQYILVTVDINGRYQDIPNRIDVQIKRSVLEQLDRGAITRDAALNQVGVTEY